MEELARTRYCFSSAATQGIECVRGAASDPPAVEPMCSWGANASPGEAGGRTRALVRLSSEVQARLASGRTGAPAQLAGEVQARSAWQLVITSQPDLERLAPPDRLASLARVLKRGMVTLH